VSQVAGEKKNQATLAAVTRLIDWYHPAVLVLEDCASRGSRRYPRVRRLIQQLRALAGRLTLRCHVVPWRRLREVATGSPTATKHQVAQALTRVFPELRKRLPPARRPWMSEDARASIFDAVALATAFFHVLAKRRRKN
jgi:Holliday junction resolvasome RuvABC endonuclease subunit